MANNPQPYPRATMPERYPQPTTALEALRYLYAIRGRAHYYGAWVKVSVQLSAGDISFCSHKIGNGGDEVYSFLTATRGLWEMLEGLRE